MTNTTKSPSRPTWLLMPALAAGLLLAACSNDPKATEPDNTATVVENPEVPPVTADSTAKNTVAP